MSLITCDLTHASSDGTVAFGDGYVVFTNFSDGGQTLSVVPFDSESSLNIISSAIPLPISYATIVTHNKTIFLRWWKKLYILKLDSHWKAVLKKQFDLPKPKAMYFENEKAHVSMRSNGEQLLLFNESNNQILDLTTYESLTEVKDISVYLANDSSHRAFSKEGDWVLKNGSCMKSDTKTLCLSIAESRISDQAGGMIYYDKLLILANSGSSNATGSTIHISRSVETVD